MTNRTKKKPCVGRITCGRQNTLDAIYNEVRRITTALFGDAEAGTSGVIHRTENLEDRALALEKDKAGNSELRLLEAKFDESKEDHASVGSLESVELRLGKLESLALQMRTILWVFGVIWTVSTTLLTIWATYRLRT